MTRNRFVVPPVVQIVALIAVAFMVSPARSAEPADTKADDAKRMIDLLDKIHQRMGNLEARMDTTLDLGKDVKQLREDVSRLQREVAELRRAGNGNSTSFYPSQPSASPSVSASMAPMPQGRVRLVNSYLTDMTAIVNGTTVVVPAGRTTDVTVPAGPVSYQILQIPQPMKTTTLVPNEMLTLTLFPVV
jgi:hypothetical protein